MLKEDDSFGAACTEKAGEIQTLSFSNRNDKEEARTALDAYLEMTGSSSKKGRQIHEDSNRKEATEPELINSDSARQQDQSARELINET